MFKLRNLSARAIGLIVGVVVLLLAAGLFVRSCDTRRSKAAQSRLEHAQGNAAAKSAADAVNTVAASGEAQAASEAQTRKNEQEIRNAKGAAASVDPAVRDAGLRSLCGRAAYRNDPRCRVLKPDPR
jgi:hypothetical protein